MTEEQFIQINSSTWRELENFFPKLNKKGIRALPSGEIKRFLHIFRLSSHHLAYVRTHFPKSNLEVYLNSLVGKSHSHVYAVRKISPGSFIRYISYGFPELLRETRLYVLSSFGFFALGGIIAMLMVFINVNNASFFLPQELIEGIKSGKMGGGEWNYPLMSSFIMVNNISVSLRAFVFGITLGLGTIYVLYQNGALLGALTALVYMYGDPTGYWSLILPHGIIELAAIFISGAAGLIIGKSMLLPGEYTRKHSLIKGTKKAVALILGVVVMLIIAGIIEGFFTPLDIPEASKLIFAGITGVVLAAYCVIPYVVKKKHQSLQ